MAIGSVRPVNLLVRDRPEGVEVLMADLSQGRLVGEPAVATTTVGSLEIDPTLVFYMPPELDDAHPVTREGDLYALGILLYQMIAGDFDRPLGPFWQRDVEDELLRQEIAGLADPDPRARPADAAEVARRLRGLEARRVALAAEFQEAEPVPENEGRRKGLFGGILRRR